MFEVQHRTVRPAGPAGHAAVLIGALMAALMLALVPGAGAAGDPGCDLYVHEHLAGASGVELLGSGGGDGWGVALSPNAVFNVFHHQTQLQLACHFQIDQSERPCPPQRLRAGRATAVRRSATTPDGNFAVGGQPGLYLDQKTGKLYVYATRPPRTRRRDGRRLRRSRALTPGRAGFCGFTALHGARGAVRGTASAAR